MAVNLSPVGGVASQFFDNDGNVLSGGKIYTYTAGTSTPATTYTTSAGSIAHTNPIILDSAGRVPGGEIWLTANINFKFILRTSGDVLIGTYDNVASSPYTDASLVTYTPAGVNAVTTTVQAKLRESVSVMDFGASPSNTSAQNTTAFQNALNAHDTLYVPDGTYLCGALTFNAGNVLLGESRQNTILTYTGSTTFITGGVDLNRVGLENISITASGSPTGYGIFFDLSTVRQPRFVNIAVTGFASAIRIDDALNGWVEQVYLGGQGPSVAGSVGLQFGESPSQSGTTWQVNNVYIVNYQVGVKTWATASMFNTLIIELCSIGFYSSTSSTVISPWFDSVTTEFSLFLNGICIIGPRWYNNTPQISVDSTTTLSRTTIIPASGDVNPSLAPSWKLGYFNIWRGGALQHDYLMTGASANYNFSIRPNTDYTHAIERKTTVGSGYNYTLQAGGAKSGETNTNGGILMLSSGTSTGSGDSSIDLYTATAGASGSTDSIPTRKWAFNGNGKISPFADGVYDIGSTGARVQRVYAKQGFVVTTPDGLNNYLIAVDNAGALTTTLI